MIKLNNKLIEYAKRKNLSVIVNLVTRPETSCG